MVGAGCSSAGSGSGTDLSNWTHAGLNVGKDRQPVSCFFGLVQYFRGTGVPFCDSER